MTKDEQDRLNAAVKAYAEKYRDIKLSEANEIIQAAQPLLEKEPRVGWVNQLYTEDSLLIHNGEMNGERLHMIELMDTPYIVQKGEKPIKLSEGCGVFDECGALVVRYQVDCDE